MGSRFSRGNRPNQPPAICKKPPADAPPAGPPISIPTGPAAITWRVEDFNPPAQSEIFTNDLLLFGNDPLEWRAIANVQIFMNAELSLWASQSEQIWWCDARWIRFDGGGQGESLTPLTGIGGIWLPATPLILPTIDGNGQITVLSWAYV